MVKRSNSCCRLIQNFFIPDSTTKEGQEERMGRLDQIMDEQFDLSYYVKGFSFQDTEQMATFERKAFYNRLLTRKQAEREARQKVNKG